MANEVKVIITAKDNATGAISKVKGGIGGLTKSIMGFSLKAVGAGVAGAGALAIGLSKIAIDSAPIQGVLDSFDALTKASGMASAEMLTDLQEASAGMVSNTELMKTYNLASNLISDKFANQLPDAMGALGKIASATGEDMGFLMDSLVRGVGRLSPMILDNLAIQVDVAQANEDYADSIGKTVDQLSKQEQQTALMNQVTDLLAEKTANMPEVLGSANQGWESLKTSLTNAKDALGVALLPLLQPIIDKVGKFAGALEPLVKWIAETADKGYMFNNAFSALPEWIKPAAQNLGGIILKIKEFVTNLQSLGLEGIKEKFISMIPPEVLNVVNAIWQAIQNLGTAFSTHIPFMIEMGGQLSTFFTENILPAFQFVGMQIAGIINQLSIFWTNHGDTVIAVITAFIEVIQALFAGGLALISSIINAVLQLINGNWQGALDTITDGVKKALDTVLSLFDTDLQSVLSNVEKYLYELWQAFSKKLEEIKSTVDDKIAPIKGAFQAVSEAIGNVIGAIQGVINKLKLLKLPDFLQPGSPTPFEIGLLGIDKAMRKLNSSALPSFESNLSAVADVGQPVSSALGAGGGGFAGAGGSPNITININGAQDAKAVANEVMRALKANGIRV